MLRAIVGGRCSWRLRNVEVSSRFLQPPGSKHARRWSAPRRQDPHMPATLASTASLWREDPGVSRDELQNGQVFACLVAGCRSCCVAPGRHHRCRARGGLGEAAAIPQDAGPIAALEMRPWREGGAIREAIRSVIRGAGEPVGDLGGLVGDLEGLVSGLGALGIGPGAPVSGPGVLVSDLGAPVSDLGAPVSGLGAPVSGPGAPVSGLGVLVSGLGVLFSGLGAPVDDLEGLVSGLGAPVDDLQGLVSGCESPSTIWKGSSAVCECSSAVWGCSSAVWARPWKPVGFCISSPSWRCPYICDLEAAS